MSIRGSYAVFVLAPLMLLAEGTARADEPVSLGPGLRPYIHTDRYERTLVDVCPERTPGGPRCLSQRIIYPDTPRPVVVPLAGGGGVCTSTGGGGYAKPPSGAMTPKDVLAAYKIPSTAHANGAIVAIAALPSTHAMTDVNTYRAAFGIPALPACPTNSMGVPTPGGTACFARVGQDGTVNTVSSTDCPGWADEVGLDMDMVSAACPDCSIVVVEADAIANNLAEMNQIAATVVGAAAVTNGWGGQEYAGDVDTYFASPNILTFAAAGSNGYDNEDTGWGTPSFPASAPNVISVGGTTLKVTGGGSYSEVVWNDDAMGGGGAGGSGCSTIFPMPSYQSSSGFNFGSCKMRALADVAAAAEFCPPTGCGYGGIAVYDVDDGGWGPLTGTGASSALAAAIMVRVGLAGKDNHALFYANGGAFNDITTGNNDHLKQCSSADDVLCNAGPQWDGPTGLGSPNGKLLLALAGGTLEPEREAGAPDSGPTADAGVDSGRIDAGSDASSKPPKHDSGAPADAGTGNEIPSSSGCACSTATSRSSWAGAGWLALGLLACTRRRTR